MPKDAKKDNFRFWVEKIFYYVELTHTICGGLISAREQLQKPQASQSIQGGNTERNNTPNGSDDETIQENGVFSENE